uniref:Ionotropic glutamate receptor C-terminal domain-containing protein n=1 Tax=Daphnia galeata TaxID=27404 RepID=A0A8J2WQI0_9CRUS|nr:unnamed protein product [Daphnia galeata]
MRPLAFVLFTVICKLQCGPTLGRAAVVASTGVQYSTQRGKSSLYSSPTPWSRRRQKEFLRPCDPECWAHSSRTRLAFPLLQFHEAELYLGALIATTSRFKDADLSSAWYSGGFSILIPIPNSSTNIGALIEPMSTNVINAYMSSYKVWICIAFSIPTVMLSLFGLTKCIVALNKRIMVKSANSEKNSRPSAGNFQITDYVVTVLLSQGGYCVRKQLAIRLAAAAWCLACFVLVQAYSSTLIAFITSPNNKPIINSVYDIPNVPGLKITVERNFAADVVEDVVLQQTNFGIYKKLGDSLREDPSLHCNATEICLDKVRSGNHVYIHREGVNRNVIAMDREKTGTCHFTIAAELFWLGHLHFLFPKKSPYSETINRGYKAS